MALMKPRDDLRSFLGKELYRGYNKATLAFWETFPKWQNFYTGNFFTHTKLSFSQPYPDTPSTTNASTAATAQPVLENAVISKERSYTVKMITKGKFIYLIVYLINYQFKLVAQLYLKDVLFAQKENNLKRFRR